jgi:hypothetical protein
MTATPADDQNRWGLGRDYSDAGYASPLLLEAKRSSLRTAVARRAYVLLPLLTTNGSAVPTSVCGGKSTVAWSFGQNAENQVKLPYCMSNIPGVEIYSSMIP